MRVFNLRLLEQPMLQKYEGPNVIQMQNGKEDLPKKELQDLIVPHPINLNICGLRTPSVMLSEYARAASTYDWCWSAALMRKEPGYDRFECSGTLIELDLVVTTAACIKRLRRKDLSDYRVVLGDSNLRDEMPYGVQYLDIAEIVAHPDYLTFWWCTC
ncbi:Chymotrypsin-like elastase family member 2A [Armadillidium nasatum]|uniref:Chymotrypsin-like elastase family member 2A n=1 Tax=Armadillidium nasatum TaxID=96803 RepID=A0A5N5TC26_9CRUS|nr:Chymotrypsin-like elastase family member 2A [Armadillidium nasatum]